MVPDAASILSPTVWKAVFAMPAAGPSWLLRALEMSSTPRCSSFWNVLPVSSATVPSSLVLPCAFVAEVPNFSTLRPDSSATLPRLRNAASALDASPVMTNFRERSATIAPFVGQYAHVHFDLVERHLSHGAGCQAVVSPEGSAGVSKPSSTTVAVGSDPSSGDLAGPLNSNSVSPSLISLACAKVKVGSSRRQVIQANAACSIGFSR